MTSIATNHIAFPDRFDTLAERRTTAQAWKKSRASSPAASRCAS